MTIKNYAQKFKKTGLVLSLGLGVLMLSGVEANAQRRDDDKRERKEEKREQKAERKEEKRERKEDRREDRRDDRRNNDDRYDDRDDNREERREDRQERREDREELRNTTNAYGNNVFRQARENGFNEGRNQAQTDLTQQGRYRNPENSNLYKRGTSGYSNRYGNKDAYRDVYRRAFIQGYNEFSRNNNNNNNRRRGY